MAAKAVASPLAFRRDVRGPLGRPAPGGCRSGTGTGTGLPGVLYWSGGAGGSRLLAARARGRNRFGGGGGGRGASRDEAAEEDEDEAADVVIVDAGDEEEYASDELSGFRGLVLDLSYRPVNVVCWKRAICLEFIGKLCRPMCWSTTTRPSLRLAGPSTSLQF